MAFLPLYSAAIVEDRPVIVFPSADTFETWLRQEHAVSSGVWVQLAKQGAPTSTLSYAEAVEVALCYGWIDGQARRLDDQYWLQKYTPRRPQSKWSKINRDKALRLINEGKMALAGLQEVERAIADGRWDAAYDGPRTATVPEDLQLALDKNERALEFFATLDSRNRYAILHRIQDAKKPETRVARIEKFVKMLSEHAKIYP